MALKALASPEEEDASAEKVDAVIVDDNETFIKMLRLYSFRGQVTTEYHNPEHFLNNVNKYAQDTKIYLDNNYDCSILTGLEVAKKLHMQGYTCLFILSGEAFNKDDIPSYVTVIEKNRCSAFEKFVVS